MSSIDYKIPKIEVKVELFTHHQKVNTPKEYVLFLNEYSRYRKGPETIFEFLNTEKHYFIPLIESQTGAFVIQNIDAIIYLKEMAESQVPPSLKRVVLFLSDNRELVVSHFKPLPESHSRVLDYLNDKNQFIVFYHQDRKVFVNKRKIIKAEEKNT
ncbi:MAG: hypothetical protein GY950_21370 [bacterium]|nr:hypothetical protein [bacterium]